MGSFSLLRLIYKYGSHENKYCRHRERFLCKRYCCWQLSDFGCVSLHRQLKVTEHICRVIFCIRMGQRFNTFLSQSTYLWFILPHSDCAYWCHYYDLDKQVNADQRTKFKELIWGKRHKKVKQNFHTAWFMEHTKYIFLSGKIGKMKNRITTWLHYSKNINTNAWKIRVVPKKIIKK